MIKTIAASLLAVVALFSSCQEASVEKQIASYMIPFEQVDQTSFEEIANRIGNSDIVILGEASHGDGRTFEVKSDLVKYLVEEKGFTTFAFESRDFLELAYVRGNLFLKDRLDEYLKEDWVRQWSPWGPAQEIQVLVDVLNTKSINPIGLETYSYSSELIALKLIEEKLKEDNQVIRLVDWELLNQLHVKIFDETYDENTSENVHLYVSILQDLFNEVIRFEAYDPFTLQLLENAITSAELKYYSALEPNSSNLNKVITLRDTQMSKNLIWYKEQHPEAKIIVWMANFHGAKELSAVTFNGEDDYSYEGQKVFAELITEKYGDKVFSLAFTSSEGKSKMPYDFEGVEETTIISPKNSLEEELALTGMDYGYIDFKVLREQKKYNEKRFHSVLLGYHNQEGSWLKVFDGLFYIKRNDRANPIK